MRYIISILLYSFVTIPVFSQFRIEGTESHKTETSQINIYYLNGMSGANIIYTATASSVRFFKFTPSGRTEIPASDITVSGTTYTISNPEDMTGYVAQKDGENDSDAIWLIDYSRYLPVLNSVSILENEDTDEDCDGRQESIYVDKTEEPLFYYTPSNITNPVKLQYQYVIEYNDAEWDENNLDFDESPKIKSLTKNPETVPSPIIDTRFIIKDEIAEILGIENKVESDEFHAVKVDPHPITLEITDEGEVPIETDENGFISAPARIKFYGYSNNATIYYIWRIYQDNDMDNYIAMYSDQDFTYEFNQAGTFTIKLEAASSNSTCVKEEEAVTIKIAESYLDVPNYFSPGDSPGVNDEFRVKHKSLIKFKCTIFNRWGNKIFQFDDPDKGWDGKYKGKYVNTGVYFYVIEATGSDGIKYKKGGDINILRSK